MSDPEFEVKHTTKSNNTPADKPSNRGHGITTMISLNSVLWIMVTVVSIASFIFTYDTRISVLEEQFASVVVKSKSFNQIKSDVNTLQLQVEQLRSHVLRLEESEEQTSELVNEIDDKVKQLQYKLNVLEEHSNASMESASNKESRH